MSERRWGIPVVGIAAGLFCVVLIYLALQVRAGGDPAIGAGQPAEAAKVPREVLLRRVIITRVIEEPAAEAPAGAAEVGPVSAAAPASAAAAPAPAAPAPPPAPAPAPVVSSGS